MLNRTYLNNVNVSSVVFVVPSPDSFGTLYYNYKQNIDSLYIEYIYAVQEAFRLIFMSGHLYNQDSFYELVSLNAVNYAYDQINDDDYFRSTLTQHHYQIAVKAYYEIAWLYYTEYHGEMMRRYNNVKDFFDTVEVISAGGSCAVKLHFTEIIGSQKHNKF